jgi:hypothetical protein
MVNENLTRGRTPSMRPSGVRAGGIIGDLKLV